MLGVSRGSYEELLEDFKDMARQMKIEIWDKEMLRRERGSMRERQVRIFVKDEEPLPPTPPLPQNLETAVNIMIDLITRTNFLLDQQKRALEEKFLKEGGYTENLYKRRVNFCGF